MTPLVRMYAKGEDRELSPHFKLIEFECRCDHCEMTIVEPELIERLERLREAVDRPIMVTSGYRCAAHQEELRARGMETAKGISTHTQGQAADIYIAGMTGAEVEAAARAVGFEHVGVAETWCHVDLRPGHGRWTYGKAK